jgi:hypothetical protein
MIQQCEIAGVGYQVGEYQVGECCVTQFASVPWSLQVDSWE